MILFPDKSYNLLLKIMAFSKLYNLKKMCVHLLQPKSKGCGESRVKA